MTTSIVAGRITEDASVKNLCRDGKSRSRDTDKYREIDHKIIRNTPYIKVFNKVTRKSENYYYMNNKINETKDYDNSSKDVYENGILPYNSEVVVPIMPYNPKEEDEKDIIGFLCIDYDSKDKFNEKYDPLMVEGIADGIYDIIKNLREMGDADAERA